MAAVIKAIKKLDKIVAKIISFCDKNDFELIITADHGNSEDMGTPEAPITAHTTNLVPLRYISHTQVQKTKKT
jgi:2,3-bisphosphoglycerate-independent phosphoglycerate mutase